MSIKTMAALGAAILLAGCSTTNRTGMSEDSNMGEALHQTMAAQVIDPDPTYALTDLETSAEKSAQAIDRYRKGTVKRPERVRSTSAAGSGSN